MLGAVGQQCCVRLHGALLRKAGAKGVLGRGELTCLQLSRFSGKPEGGSSCSSFCGWSSASYPVSPSINNAIFSTTLAFYFSGVNLCVQNFAEIFFLCKSWEKMLFTRWKNKTFPSLRSWRFWRTYKLVSFPPHSLSPQEKRQQKQDFPGVVRGESIATALGTFLRAVWKTRKRWSRHLKYMNIAMFFRFQSDFTWNNIINSLQRIIKWLCNTFEK